MVFGMWMKRPCAPGTVFTVDETFCGCVNDHGGAVETGKNQPCKNCPLGAHSIINGV